MLNSASNKRERREEHAENRSHRIRDTSGKKIIKMFLSSVRLCQVLVHSLRAEFVLSPTEISDTLNSFRAKQICGTHVSSF